MANFINVVPGLREYLGDAGFDASSGNIEALYADMAEDADLQEHKEAIEKLMSEYFASLHLPARPTIYDRLILSLRSKDMIATFNWDPFLWQAWNRVGHRIGRVYLPNIAYLHGNVALGYCDSFVHQGQVCFASRGLRCQCGGALKDSPILYPIAKKDYSGHPAIRDAWKDVCNCLQRAYIFTIFGYGAPNTDAEAVNLLKDAWGDSGQRTFELVEIVDIARKHTLVERWKPFKPGSEHHFLIRRHWRDTWLARNPRRSCETLLNTRMFCRPGSDCPFPRTQSWASLIDWVRPLLAEEI